VSALMTVSELARAVAALDTRGDGRIGFSSVSTDTRTLAPGALYVALRGERFDGHDYVAAAREGGAAAALVERLVDVDLPQVVVADSRRALDSERPSGARGSRCPSSRWLEATARPRSRR